MDQNEIIDALRAELSLPSHLRETGADSIQLELLLRELQDLFEDNDATHLSGAARFITDSWNLESPLVREVLALLSRNS